MAKRQVRVTCPICGGSGKALAELITCGNCNGQGTVVEEIVVSERSGGGDAGVGCVFALLTFVVVFAVVLAGALLLWLFEQLSTREGRSSLGKLVLVVILVLVGVGAVKLAVDPEYTLVELGLVSYSSIWIDGQFHEIVPRPFNYGFVLLTLISLTVLTWGQSNYTWLTDAFRCIGALLSSIWRSLQGGWDVVQDLFDF